MNGFAQYWVSHDEPSLSEEERAPFTDLADGAYYEIRRLNGRILCRGIVKVAIDWHGILGHLTAIGRNPEVLAVTEMDGRPRGTEWEVLEDDSRRLIGEPTFPINRAAYEEFFAPIEGVDEDGNPTLTPFPPNTGGGWAEPLWDEPIYTEPSQ